MSAFGLAVSALHCVIDVDLNVNAESRVQIVAPPSFRKESGYNHTQAHFGWFPSNSFLEHTVYYVDDFMCDSYVSDQHIQDHAWPKYFDSVAEEYSPPKAPFILMIDRGNCNFVQKVRNAQHAGATAVLIVDNICLCSSGSRCTSANDAACESLEPEMGDDGSGGDIVIPSLMILKEDGDALKAAMKAGTFIRTKLSWTGPNKDHVDYELWTSPNIAFDGETSMERDFANFAKALGNSVTFTPHVYISDGEASGCLDSYGRDICGKMCTNHGRYCAQSTYDPTGTISGADVITESLRWICIWRERGEDGTGLAWWKYVQEFLRTCTGESFANDECITNAMKSAGINRGAIDDCMSHSGGVEAHVENIILRDEMHLAHRKGVYMTPKLFISHMPYRVRPTAGEAFETICAQFSAGSQPEACLRCTRERDFAPCFDRANEGGGEIPADTLLEPDSAPPAQKSVSHATFFVSVIALVGTLSAAGVIYHQRARRNMQTQVRGILSEYMLLDNSNDNHDASLEAVAFPPSADAGAGSVRLGQLG